MRVHQEMVENVVCGVCSKTFANLANLKIHAIDVHNEIPDDSPKSAVVPNKGNALVEIKN